MCWQSVLGARSTLPPELELSLGLCQQHPPMAISQEHVWMCSSPLILQSMISHAIPREPIYLASTIYHMHPTPNLNQQIPSLSQTDRIMTIQQICHKVTTYYLWLLQPPFIIFTISLISQTTKHPLQTWAPLLHTANPANSPPSHNVHFADILTGL